jgi:23S rRNA pseudouridine1911/1915/1917 synthase
VLRPLRAGNQRGIEHGAVELFDRRVALLDDADNAVAFLAARLFAHDPKDLLEPCDLSLRFPQMISKRRPGVQGATRYNSGVTQSPAAGARWVTQADDAGVRLDKFLAAPQRLGSRGRVAEALDKGKVFVNEQEASRRDGGTTLRAGDVVRLWMDRPGSAKRRPRSSVEAGNVEILYEDDALMVVNKPAGLLSVPLPRKPDEASAYDDLETHLRPRGKRKPLVVHRIDRDTSGLVVFARTIRAQQALKDQFRRREPERVYLAVVYGHPEPREGTWRDHLVWDSKALIQRRTRAGDPAAKEAISRYRVLETLDGASLIEVRLVTGKRNQIRLQARLRGHTLVGEQRYVYGPDALRSIECSRQALHAHRLSFLHPVDGRPLTFEAPLPADLSALVRRLRTPVRPAGRSRRAAPSVPVRR